MVIGLFGVSEVLLSVERSFTRDIFETKIKGLLPNLQDWKDSFFPTLRSSVLSFLMAIIPGISVVIPTFICYSLEKRISKHPEKFGTGIIEGVAVPEAANNGAGVGSMVPLLSLGIPTGASSALVLGALLIYGLHPGPLLVKESPEVFWGVIGSMYIGNAMLLLLNLPLIRIWVSILKIPYAFLFSSIILFCLIGAYTINNGVADMYLMILFGIVGYLMRKFDYDPVPLILALVLGPMLENAFRRSMLLSDGSVLIFFARPISGVLLSLALVMLISPVFMKKRLGEEMIHEGEE
jgi:putative tricarboxylic transport membrane protein